MQMQDVVFIVLYVTFFVEGTGVVGVIVVVSVAVFVGVVVVDAVVVGVVVEVKLLYASMEYPLHK